jgi:Domain of unknown function (DUF1877)
MSMIGEYARLTPAELQRAISDPEWLMDYIDELKDGLDEAELWESDWDGSDDPPGRAKLYSTYKTWNLLAHLLHLASFPVNVIHGEHVLDPDQDWGYGPASYLTPDRVKYAANALDATPYSRLAQGVTSADLNAAEIYPMPWEADDSAEWGRQYYERLTAFFGAAADAGDAVLCWLD